MRILSKKFFEDSTLNIAQKLLGKILVHKTQQGIISGKIVETEAYLIEDPACHASHGMTKSNAMMFEQAGKAYVYFIYGMHYCFNLVTNKKGMGEAVLIRALEPMKGMNIMKKKRKVKDEKNLCNGPAKLTQALGITRQENGIDLLDKKSKLFLIEGNKEKLKVVHAKRIGISQAKEKLYRFYIKDNLFISKK